MLCIILTQINIYLYSRIALKRMPFLRVRNEWMIFIYFLNGQLNTILLIESKLYIYLFQRSRQSKVQQNMKVTLALSLIAVFLLQSAVTLDCPKGYYDPGSGATKCNRCDKVFTECTAPLVGTVNSRIVGYKVVGSSPSPYCAQYSGVWSYYNKEDNNCHVICKLGCDKCNTDYDFCTDCSAGFTWNPDYTCLPAVIGLQAASLALLVIALVFSLIGCCTVIKAKKN